MSLTPWHVLKPTHKGAVSNWGQSLISMIALFIMVMLTVGLFFEATCYTLHMFLYLFPCVT